MNFVDAAVVIAYFILVIGFGIWYRRRAARDLESYFLGRKRLHWTLLSMSGAVSNFDITGTMWMVSIVYLIGMKSWWHFQMSGFILPAFCLAFIGKWVRRSNVMTGAERMMTRFGNTTAGQVARSAYAILAVVTCVSFVGYAFQGIGKFGSLGSWEFRNLGISEFWNFGIWGGGAADLITPQCLAFRQADGW